ncbi:MAG: hypothetical protein KC917_23835, partial [Candidatus Omnitrophica bacterium]|nr:hypothetical protein [Candidatus Omnitrophota bacterium]
MRSLSAPHARADSSSQTAESTRQPTARTAQLSPEAAQRIVMALMVPSMLMPIASGMSRVALPIIRNDFGLTADMTAWVATSYT